MTKNSTKSTMKFLIYMISFIVIVLVFVLLFVIPSIKEYKNAKTEYLYTEQENSKLEIKKGEIEKKLEQSKNNNKNITSHFYKEFNSSKFSTFAKAYFNNIKLQKLQNKIDSSALEIYQFNAIVKAKNPRMLYDFINELKSYENIIKINFPIAISTVGSNLQIDFHLSIYTMTQK